MATGNRNPRLMFFARVCAKGERAELGEGRPAVELGIRLTQLGDDLFGSVLLAFHREFFLALRAG